VPVKTRLWFSAEYLVWWIKDGPLPGPLVTSCALADANPGAIGQPGTRALLGDDDIDNKARTGGRFTAGYWFDCDQTVGAEATYLFLGKRTITQTVSADGAPGSPIIGVPFFSPTPGMEGESFLPLSFPPLFGIGEAGRATLSLSNFLQGAEATGVINLPLREVWPGALCAGWRVDVVAGFRYLQLDENLCFATDTGTAPPFDLMFSRQTVDTFDTRNRFYGGQLGARAEYASGKVFVRGTAKFALGDVHETVDVSGQTTTNTFGFPSTTPGGIFAQPSNSGHFTRDKFAVIPEVTLRVGYQFTESFSLFAGYNFLFVSEVLRPGDQMDRGLNLSQSPAFGTGVLVGPARPMPLLSGSSFWAQGLDLGLEVRF
jgi:hypothetical protein